MAGEASFSVGELESMRNVQEAHMMDTCIEHKRTTIPGVGYGPVQAEYVSQLVPIPCGIKVRSSKKYMADTQVGDWELELRIPLSASIQNTSRVEVETIQGTVIHNLYEIVGPMIVGPTGKRIRLRAVTDGS